MSSSSPASVPVSTSPVAVGANQPKGSPNKLSENGAKPVLPQQQQQPPAMAAKPAAPRPIQPVAAQPSAAVPPASASSSMFDLGSMSNISFGSLGSLGSLSSLGMDSTKPGEPMPLPSGGAPRPPQQQPQSQPPQQQRPMTGQPAQQQPRPAQPGAGARPPAPSGQQPLAPLQAHPSAPSSAVPTSGAPVMPQQQQPAQAPGSPSSTSTAVVRASPGSGDRRVINPVTVPNGQNFVDITEYLNMPQSEAAKKLGIPPSTLSKRWKEAVRNRKWPWRVVCKLDKEIMTLLHNVPQGAPIPEEIEGRLGYLMRKRQEELKPVVIRL